MAHKCQITSKSRLHGHRVSHANNKTKHVFFTNLQTKRIFVPSLNKFVRLKLTTRAIRTIDKLGIDEALKKYKVRIEDVMA